MFQDNNSQSFTNTYSKLSYHIGNYDNTTKKDLLDLFLKENKHIHDYLIASNDTHSFRRYLRLWLNKYLQKFDHARAVIESESAPDYSALKWEEMAALRIADYIDHQGLRLLDPNEGNREIINEPFIILFNDYKGMQTNSTKDFYIDLIALFRQVKGVLSQMKPDKAQIKKWMDKHPTGLDADIAAERIRNKERILKIIIQKIDSGELKSASYQFGEGLSAQQKYEKALKWWDTSKFHLVFAFRTPEIINEMMGNSLDTETIHIMQKAKDAGIPFFVNPYYLSLVSIEGNNHADIPLRDYIFYSEELVNEFGDIHAWEKEDIVKPGEPNAAGWILPMEHNIHRRYPEVSILIPDTVGRACGGLCVSCQRMYDFQSGHLNFDLDKLKPKETWPEKLDRLMDFFENDSQLRDILITGGDALMNTDKSLKKILDAVYEMAIRKIEANKERPNGEKFAEMKRVRLGTRLPVYIPQRITEGLTEILRAFKEKASAIGFEQFVLQTHFQTAMEITPEVEAAVKRISDAGWIVCNQQVFTTASSRRGHSAKLRRALNDIGVLTYYTFSVKGFKENKYNFATNARIVQELNEEKWIGQIPSSKKELIKEFPKQAEHIKENINKLRDELDIPYLSTDRSVLNMPGVGKSLTFKVIGITSDGRRILEFDHDHNRRHSPIVDKMGKVTIIESKTITELLQQLEEMGEEMHDYVSIFGYSTSMTEDRMSIFEYPEYDYQVTDHMTNLEV